MMIEIAEATDLFKETQVVLDEKGLPLRGALVNMCRRFEKVKGIKELLQSGEKYQTFHEEVDLQELTKTLMEIDVTL